MTNNLALTESQSLRDDKLQSVSNDQALEAINKAKSLVMASWKGENLATVVQLANFYEVSEETVRTVIKRHKDELEQDGLKVLRGKAFESYRESCQVQNELVKARSLTVFTPKAALRLGMLLRDSEVAKSVRDIILHLAVEVVPQQSETIEELKLQNEILDKQLKLRELDNTMILLHGKQTVLALRGYDQALVEVEKPTIEIIDNRHNVKFKGQTLKQIAEYLTKKTGRKFKNGGEIKRELKRLGLDHLICSTPRSIVSDYVPDENLGSVYRALDSGNRQLLLGE
jgi:hypothetical protein